MLPPVPAPAVMLPATKVPVMFAVPVIFAPVLVTTTTLEVPDTPIVTLPLATGMFTLLLPLLIPVPVGTAAQVNTPEPFVCK